MALIKEKTLANGAVGNYWKTIYSEFSKETMMIVFVMELFKDQSYATNGNLRPLGCRKAFTLPITMDDLNLKPFQVSYTKLLEKLIEDPSFDEDLFDAVSG